MTHPAPISPRFVKEQSRELLLIARLAEMYHRRPSEFLHSTIRDWQFDLACAVRLWEAERDPESRIKAEGDAVPYVYPDAAGKSIMDAWSKRNQPGKS